MYIELIFGFIGNICSSHIFILFHSVIVVGMHACVCVYIADMEADWVPAQALTHGSHLQPLIVVYIIL